MVRSTMSLVDLPISFWGYALLTAAHILNRTPSKVVEETPYEIWETKGYYFYNQSENKVFVARDGVFLESQLLSEKSSGRNIHFEEVQDDQPQITSPVGAQDVVSTSVEHTTDVVKPIRRTSRKSNPPKRDPLERYFVNVGYDVFLLDVDESTTYKEVMASVDSEKWLVAMKSEMESMHDNKDWNLVDLPKGTRPVEYK
ncbi:UNVERIFIED_CONTAM: hypothetical protein Sradi_1532500 [Sesamum radiatum]|uniref:Uncharacterized protein n=1 Tax=Sesamum radiatum TaxID=300843 RepID=A0AAW2U868_SESRA